MVSQEKRNSMGLIDIIKKNKSRFTGLKTGLNTMWSLDTLWLVGFWGVLSLASCASMQTPSGGPKDTNPPKVKKETPKNLSTGFSAKTIEIEFDEFVKLNNAFSEISISPTLDKPLDIRARKSVVEINIDQPLEANTTYTINFGKAIGDVNENNLLKNYSYVFSTGRVLDSLSVSGAVRGGLNNEPVKDALVFVFPADQDSLLGKKKPSIYTLTDEKGGFLIKNLRSQAYRLYAIKETAADRIYNQGVDEIGFVDSVVDLRKNVAGLNMRLFKEEPAVFKTLDKKIEGDGRIVLSFNRSVEDLNIRDLETNTVPESGIVEFGAQKDSVLMWFPELTFDSLALRVYSGQRLLDRVNIIRNKREVLNRTPTLKYNLVNNKLKPGVELEIVASMPILSTDSTKIVLMADSVEAGGWRLTRKDGSERRFALNYPFRSDVNYVLKLSEGAFTGISGLKTAAYSRSFEADGADNYSTLSLVVDPEDRDKQYLLQLLNEKKDIVRVDVISGNTVLRYPNYRVGKYSLRFIEDANRNGKWDSGSLENRKQPEKTRNYDTVITLRANWDLEEKIKIPRSLF